MATLALNIDPSGMEVGARRGQRALEKLKSDAKATEAANDNLSRSYAELKARLDPAFAAGQRFGRGQRIINDALKSGAISAKQAQQATRQLEAEYRRTSATTAKLAGNVKLLAAAIPAAAVAFATRSVSAYRDHNKALAEVSTLLQGTADETEFLDAAAKNLAARFGIDATQQVQAFYQAISAGVGDAAQAAEFLETANKLAVGGVTDITTSVDLLTTTINAYERQGLRADRASDILFAGVRVGKTTIDELAASLGNVVPIASSLDVSLEEVVASVATLTLQGQKTSVAVTGVRQALATLLKPSSEAVEQARALGLEFDAEAVKARGLTGVLEDVIRATGGNQEQMARLFGSVEALNAVLGLTANNGAQLRASLDATGNSAGALEEAFGKMNKELVERLNKQLQIFKNVSLEVGEIILSGLVPGLEQVTGTTGEFADEVSGLIDLLKSPEFLKFSNFFGALSGLQQKAAEAIKSGASGFADLISGAFSSGSGSNISTGVRSPEFGGPNPQGGFPLFRTSANSKPIPVTISDPQNPTTAATTQTVSSVLNGALRSSSGFTSTTENGFTVIRPKKLEDESERQNRTLATIDRASQGTEKNTDQLIREFRDLPSNLKGINENLLPQLLQANNDNATKLQQVLSGFFGSGRDGGISGSSQFSGSFTGSSGFDHLGTSGSLTISQQNPLLRPLQRDRQQAISELQDLEAQRFVAQNELTIFDAQPITSLTEQQRQQLTQNIANIDASIASLENELININSELTDLAQRTSGPANIVNLGSFATGGSGRIPGAGATDSVTAVATVSPGEFYQFGDPGRGVLESATRGQPMNIREGDTVVNLNMPSQPPGRPVLPNRSALRRELGWAADSVRGR